MIEIIMAGRNDAFGGADFVDRLCAAASANHEALAAAGVAHRFTLVEWNPIAGRKSLSAIVTARLPWWDNCYIVSPEWHQRLSLNPHLQFMEFFAKNVAIRRSKAPVILTTNSDVFLSEAVVARLAQGGWQDGTIYRAERFDIDRRVNWREPRERTFADPANQIRVNRVAGPDYTNSAGDFLLLTRETYHALGGFNETVRFAKIHKDGQFCHRAWRRGFAFEVLGPIWHIDHDGSYANAGASRGSATAPYGPEWDYRTDYENPIGWGLLSAIPERSGRRTITLQHPSTHGPLVSLIVSEGAGADEEDLPKEVELLTPAAAPSLAHAINESLARARGRYLCIAPGPPNGELANACAAAARELDGQGGDLGISSSCVTDSAAVGGLPVDAAPIVLSRSLYERLGGWDHAEADPWRAYFLEAARRCEPTRLSTLIAVPAGGRCAASLRRGLIARTRTTRGGSITMDDRSAAACEFLSSAADLRGWMSRFVEQATSRGANAGVPAASESAGPRPDQQTLVCGVVGLDWATPWLLETFHAQGRACAGVFSTDQREVGTVQWGERVRALPDIAEQGVTNLFITAARSLVLERIVASGYHRAVHVLTIDPSLTLAPRTPSELERLRALQARDLQANAIEAVLARLDALAALEGPHWALHAYDAAMLCDRHGRKGDALRLFSDAASPRNANQALRARAAFHLGRLLADSHEDARAVQVFDSVLTEQPDHGKAWEYLVTVLRRATDAAKLEARLSPPIRERWRQGVFAPGYAR